MNILVEEGADMIAFICCAVLGAVQFFLLKKTTVDGVMKDRPFSKVAVFLVLKVVIYAAILLSFYFWWSEYAVQAGLGLATGLLVSGVVGFISMTKSGKGDE